MPSQGDRRVQDDSARDSDRLDQVDEAVYEIREALDVHFKRICAMQAQLDQLVALISQLRQPNLRG